jgi:nucleotide-binding universal stress UspA family protein
MVAFKRILVPIDFSPHSAYMLEWAAAFARGTGGRLELLHVCALHAEGVKEAEAEMQAVVPADIADVVGSRRVVRAISADLGILHAAREDGADVVIMGTHGRSGFKHVLMGSVAERVVQLAECPVLTVPHPEHRFERP